MIHSAPNPAVLHRPHRSHAGVCYGPRGDPGARSGQGPEYRADLFADIQAGKGLCGNYDGTGELVYPGLARPWSVAAMVGIAEQKIDRMALDDIPFPIILPPPPGETLAN